MNFNSNSSYNVQHQALQWLAQQGQQIHQRQLNQFNPQFMAQWYQQKNQHLMGMIQHQNIQLNQLQSFIQPHMNPAALSGFNPMQYGSSSMAPQAFQTGYSSPWLQPQTIPTWNTRFGQDPVWNNWQRPNNQMYRTLLRHPVMMQHMMNQQPAEPKKKSFLQKLLPFGMAAAGAFGLSKLGFFNNTKAGRAIKSVAKKAWGFLKGLFGGKKKKSSSVGFKADLGKQQISQMQKKYGITVPPKFELKLNSSPWTFNPGYSLMSF